MPVCLPAWLPMDHSAYTPWVPTGGKVWDNSKLPSGCGWQEMQMQMHLHFHRSGSFILALGQATLFSKQIWRTSVQGSGGLRAYGFIFCVCVPNVPHTQAFVQRSSRRWATFQLIIHQGRKSKAEVPPFKNKVELVPPESLLGTQFSPDPDLLNHNLPSYRSSGRFVGTGCWGLLFLDGGSCPQKQTKPQPFIGDELQACLYKILACQEELDTELRGSLGEQ